LGLLIGTLLGLIGAGLSCVGIALRGFGTLVSGRIARLLVAI
jgi:hypothetical protein